MRFSLQKKFFLAFFSIGVILVLLTAGVMHHEVREGFDEYVTNAKLKRLGKVESVLVHMYNQDGSLEVLRKSGAWTELLTSIEAVRREQFAARGTEAPNSNRNPETVAREDKAIASSVSIMLQNRGADVEKPADPIPIYARGVALLDARGMFLAGETVDAQNARFEPIRNEQKQIIAYWLVSRDGSAYDSLARTFMDQQLKVSLLMLAIAAALSGIIAWSLSMHFRRPIADLQTGFRAVAAGQLNTRLNAEQGNEIGDIATHFNRMTAQLEAQESARRQWVADTSHELRTPLTVLRMRTEAMRDGIVPNTDEEWQRSIKCIEDLTVLVNDLQLMARATSGQWDLHIEPIEVNQWLAGVVDSHKPAFEQANLTLSFVPMMQPVVIRGDEQRLQQVIRNILVNSLRYTDAPGQVVVSLMQCDMGIKICIKDSAPGVPEEALSHLFERFYRVDGSRNRASGGSGLGLAISQGIIAAHQGNITVAHSDLGGLQVNIELPLQLDAMNEKPAKKSKKATGLTS
ncbi:MAG: ATP-binding protein [Burkholderiales bacterium]|nr:ATP-binding protein [Burkholderiales bacterium]